MSGENDEGKPSDLARIARKAIADLTPSERELLQRRFGLRMDSMPALEELGQQFMIVRERIRAIERKARAKLRKSPEDPNDDPGSTG
jgi:RNA polymerase sigma factor (sigma-70 family)